MSAAVERAVRAKFQWRVLTPIVVLIVLSSLDRVNISFAALQMNDELGLSPEDYGRAVGIFFVGYVLFQLPSTALLTRIGARKWIAACVIAWGAVATMMAFSRNAVELYVLRFLLGAAESGFAPGVVYYISTWMPARYRANTIAITMLAVPISVIVGGPLCGWLMTAANPFALPGWRFMMLAEGAITIAMGVLAAWIFVDRASEAQWLSDEEKGWVEQEHARELQTKPAMRATAPLGALMLPAVWLSAGVWATTLIGANGMMFWLPQVLKQQSTHGDFAIGFFSAVPWLGVGLGMLLNSWHSDKTQERFAHVGVALLVAALALYGASLTTGPAALALLFASGVGLGSAQGVFWAIPTTALPQQAAPMGITFINLVGNLGSLLGPYAIGVIRAQSESFDAPIWFVAAALLGGLVLLMLLHSKRHAFA